MQDRTVKAFIYDSKNNSLKVLNQLLLPKVLEYVDVPDSSAGHDVIKSMMVRGAPCLAAVACLSLVVDLTKRIRSKEINDYSTLMQHVFDKVEHLQASRPTAINLKNALDKISSSILAMSNNFDRTEIPLKIGRICDEAIKLSLAMNENIGQEGYMQIIGGRNLKPKEECKLNILTHCNTGSLATVGYGTALGVVRALHSNGNLKRVYCTETRPYNQGSRLTAWEMCRENIPATLIADNMVAFLMATEEVDVVVVGADCIAKNGDTANKIGTLQIAITAQHYCVPFYVAAPHTTFSANISSGSDILVEQRPAEELRRIGNVDLAPADIDVWNPCFDITPAHLITGIITEFGTCKPEQIQSHLDCFGISFIRPCQWSISEAIF